MDEEEIPQSEPQEETKDEKSISADLIRGHINTIILRSLADGDKYGYEIIAEIERKSHGQYSLKQPSLYSALKRLEREGYITSYWGGSVGGGRRKYFSLTDEGRTITEQNQSEWEYSRTIIDSLISDKDFDFSNPAPSLVNMRMLRDTTSRVPSRDNGEDDEVEYEPTFEDKAERERLNAELEEKNAELERERAAFEEDRARYEEELRAYRENEELLRAEKEEHERIAAEEKQRAETLILEQNAADEERQAIDDRIRSQEIARAEERAQYEAAIKERDEMLEEERLRRERELKEQEQRILEEQEALFRKREQELLHQNYLNLVNTPPAPAQEPQEYNYYTAPVAQDPPEKQEEPAKSEEDEREYRAVVKKMYDNSTRDKEQPRVTERARSLGGIDFNDVEARAAQDGIRVITAGTKTAAEKAERRSQSVVHKGKALFLSALVVFLLCAIEGGIVLGVREQFGIPVYLPYLMWGIALAALLACGLAYANHYGERALRRTGPVLINTVVVYALAVILTLIVALSANIDFTSTAALASFIVIPIVYLFGIVVFGVTYYFQIRPKKD